MYFIPRKRKCTDYSVSNLIEWPRRIRFERVHISSHKGFFSFMLLLPPRPYWNAFELATPEEVTSADAITYIESQKRKILFFWGSQLPADVTNTSYMGECWARLQCRCFFVNLFFLVGQLVWRHQPTIARWVFWPHSRYPSSWWYSVFSLNRLFLGFFAVSSVLCCAEKSPTLNWLIVCKYDVTWVINWLLNS